MNLSKFFASPKPAVRVAAWLLTFLLLALLWLMVLRYLPLDGVFTSLSSAGLGETHAILAITTVPPFTAAFLCWAGLQAFSTAAARPLVAGVQPASVPTPAESASLAELAQPLAIAAWSAVTPLGDAAVTVARSLAGERAFKLDSKIQNDEGNPVHAAVVQDLPLEAFGFSSATRSRAQRTAAMLVTVLDSLFSQQEKMARATVVTKVYLLRPEALPSDEETRQNFAAAWAYSSWGQGKYELHLLPAATSNIYVTLSVLARHMAAESGQHVLLLAADSLIDPDELRTSLALQEIFSNTAPEGFVPGEGGAGLLLASLRGAKESNLVGMCSLGTVQQQCAADRGASGGKGSDTLPSAMAAAMAAEQTVAGEIGMVVSDTDHRLPRNMEVIQAMQQVLPEMDLLTQRLAPMALTGYMGVATDLVHLALAAEVASERVQPVLVVSVGHARNTAAVVITPSVA